MDVLQEKISWRGAGRPILLGELAESEKRLRENHDGGAIERTIRLDKPTPLRSLADVITYFDREEFGLTDVAAELLSQPNFPFDVGEPKRRFRNASLTKLGIREQVPYSDLLRKAHNITGEATIVPAISALHLLTDLKNREVGEYLYLLMEPLSLGNDKYVFWLSGDGPILRATSASDMDRMPLDHMVTHLYTGE